MRVEICALQEKPRGGKAQAIKTTKPVLTMEQMQGFHKKTTPSTCATLDSRLDGLKTELNLIWGKKKKKNRIHWIYFELIQI